MVVLIQNCLLRGLHGQFGHRLIKCPPMCETAFGLCFSSLICFLHFTPFALIMIGRDRFILPKLSLNLLYSQELKLLTSCLRLPNAHNCDSIKKNWCLSVCVHAWACMWMPETDVRCFLHLLYILFLFYSTFLLNLFTCLLMFVSDHVNICVPQHTCGGQRTACRS